MTVTLRPYTQLANVQSTSGEVAWRGETSVWGCKAGLGTDPLGIEELVRLGRPTSIPDFSPNISTEDIKVSYPKVHVFSIPTEDKAEYTFTFDIWSLAALQMAIGTNKLDFRYATGGQTTIATGATTKTSCILTAVTDLAVSDWCLVSHSDTEIAPELVILKSVDTGTKKVTFEGASKAPVVGRTFKKLAGNQTGTNKDDVGIYLPMGAVTDFGSYNVVVETALTGSRGRFVVNIPELEITSVSIPKFDGVLSTLTIKGMPKVQPEKTFTKIDGSTESKGWYIEGYIVPNESPNTP